MEMRESMEEMDFREAYEREHLKCADLAGRIADLEAKNEELEWKLNRIKNNPLWKASRPARDVLHWIIRQRDRLRNCGGPRGVLQKLSYKKRERQAMKQFGTESFPSPEQAAAAVRGHEMEHVVREQASAAREDRKVVSQTVSIHTEICPECGDVYVSGGTTRTVTAAENQPEQAKPEEVLKERVPFFAVA